jgi:hypothetical protein
MGIFGDLDSDRAGRSGDDSTALGTAVIAVDVRCHHMRVPVFIVTLICVMSTLEACREQSKEGTAGTGPEKVRTGPSLQWRCRIRSGWPPALGYRAQPGRHATLHGERALQRRVGDRHRHTHSVDQGSSRPVTLGCGGGRSHAELMPQFAGRALPQFVTDSRAAAAFAVAIPSRYAADELVERMSRTPWSDDNRRVLDRYVHDVAFVELQRSRNRFRKTQSETVPQFRDPYGCSHDLSSPTIKESV